VSRPALPERRYRTVDAATKLVGVALVAGALEAGIGSAPGLALALAGVALGVCTVFITELNS
jgi:hypothetical protein